MHALERRAEIRPLARGQLDFKATASLDKGIQDHPEVVQICPQPPSLGQPGGDHLRDALLVQEAGQRHPHLVECAAFQLQEIRLPILRQGAIDRRIHIRAQRQEAHLAQPQPVGSLDAGAHLFLGDIGWLKHARRMLPSTLSGLAGKTSHASTTTRSNPACFSRRSSVAMLTQK